jgi:hypothetical protein
MAHDFWIEPSRFDPPLGTATALRFMVGDGFDGDPVPRPGSRLVRFAAVDAGGERSVAGVDGVDPAGFVVVERPGWLAVGYEGNAAWHELDAARFERYLAEEGLERIRRQRAVRGDSERPGRELFARSSKTLLRPPGDRSPTTPPRLGLPLELSPETDPHTLTPGEILPLRLLYRGVPLPGVRVVAMPRAEPSAAHSGRTDAAGRVRLPLDRSGVWLIKAVHMEPAPATSGADWLSWWASLTFEIPGG